MHLALLSSLLAKPDVLNLVAQANKYGGGYYDDGQGEGEGEVGGGSGNGGYERDNDLYPPPRQPKYMPRTQPKGATFSSLFQNQRQMGAGLLFLGLILTFMGMMLFFEGNLLRLGNICFISGATLLIGPNNVRAFFMKESRMRATIITAIGIILVFWGKPRLGILFEIFGLLNLFGNMFPMLIALGKSIPGVGDIISAFEGGAKGGGRDGGRRRQRGDAYQEPF